MCIASLLCGHDLLSQGAVCVQTICNIDIMQLWQGFQGEWLWSGTSDMSAWLSVPAALYIVEGIGRQKWMLHNARLLKKAAALLHKAFGTEHVLGESHMQPCMLQTLSHGCGPHQSPCSGLADDAERCTSR